LLYGDQFLMAVTRKAFESSLTTSCRFEEDCHPCDVTIGASQLVAK
jgi:hypothetical protein